MTAPELIVCGSLTIDNVLTAEGVATPQTCGGNVVYAALGARVWSRYVGAVSRAGAGYPTSFLGRLAAHGVDTAGIARLPEPHGMNVAFRYRADGSRERAFPPDVMARIPTAERARFTDYTTHGIAHRFRTWLDFAPGGADLPAAWRAGARGVHLAAMPVERHLEIARALRRARPDLMITLDSPWHDEREPARDCHTELFGLIDVLLPSEADLSLYRPGNPPLDTARALVRAGARAVVVKQGAAGCTILGAEGATVAAVPSHPAAAVDPTGAGDAFCGGFLAGLVARGDLVHAAVAGTVAASFAVEAVGPATLFTVDDAAAARRVEQVLGRVQRF
ncbi:MAG: carbohydrate kinase family protein [Proteobacteria bacterium]|nr:carbohydrate kinase family protein [Pseudomonadota bacterium]